MEKLVEQDPTPLAPHELGSLPVFPLPRVVFFPGTVLPLHLFEARYCRMIEDCMESGPKAMAVTLLQPGWENDYEGRPPIHPFAGAGRIVGHASMDDGTHNILLQGMHRVQLDELPEEPDVPYRRARATVAEDHGQAEMDDVRVLWSCASAVAILIRQEHPDFSLGVRLDDGAGRVADIVTDRLVARPDQRQRILETLDLAERVRLATDAVGELLAALRPGVDN